MHGAATRLLSSVMVVLGLAMLAGALARGGGPLATGVVLGVLFIATGAGRLYLARRSG
jgi:hypothetical protein